MDHVVYVDAKAKDRESLLSGEKTMIIRGAAGRKLPYGRVHSGDLLYLINSNAEGAVKAKAKTRGVINTDKMSKEESVALVEGHKDQLQLTARQFKRRAGKRHIELIEVEEVEPLAPFLIDRSDYGNMDDWLPVRDLESVRV